MDKFVQCESRQISGHDLETGSRKEAGKERNFFRVVVKNQDALDCGGLCHR